MDAERSSETTPLLSNPLDTQTIKDLPYILDGLILVQARGIDNIDLSEHYPESLPTVTTQTAYKLLILLQWSISLQDTKNTGINNIWDIQHRQRQTCRDLQVLEHNINDIWHAFVCEYRTEQDIREVLWSRFPLRKDVANYIRGAFFFQCCGFGPT